MNPLRCARWLLLFGLSTASACAEPTPKLHVESSTVVTGEDIVVVFDDHLDGRATNQYWIALQRPDAPLSDTTGRILLERSDRSVRLHTNAPGDLEVRLHGGYPRLEHHLLARIPVSISGWPVKAGTEQTMNGNECLDRWLFGQKLDPYGAPEGTAYAGGSPLFDESTGRWTTRWDYVASKHPEVRTACEGWRR